jgi:hypothetical protein
MNGDPLSSTWQRHRQDVVRRDNLYRSISRILLDLAKVPLPRIGSWRLDGLGTISLTNRPLLGLTMLWNRHEIPTGIHRVRVICYLPMLYVHADVVLAIGCNTFFY